MKRLLITLSLSTALMIPFYSYAAPQDHDNRYYDKHHKDYHQWDDREDKAWHMYWEQRHRTYVDWSRASESQRQAYWDWRHRHSDVDLHIDIRH